MAVSLNKTATPGSTSTSTTVTCTLTGVPANDVIMVCVNAEATSAQGSWTVSSVTATGLTFTRRGTKHDVGRGSGFQGTETWWAIPASTFTGTITVTFSHTMDDSTVHAFSVTGTDTSNPFGIGTSPSTASVPFTGTAAPVNATITAPAHSFVFATAGSSASSATFYGVTVSGFANISTVANTGGTNFQYSAADYQIPTSSFSGAAGWSNNFVGWTCIADALIPPSSPPISPQAQLING